MAMQRCMPAVWARLSAAMLLLGDSAMSNDPAAYTTEFTDVRLPCILHHTREAAVCSPPAPAPALALRAATP